MTADILIVDDEPDICLLLESILQDEGYTTRSANKDSQAMEAIRQQKPTLCVLDIWLEGSKVDGLQLLENIKREFPSIPIIMISGHGTIEAAVTAIKRGAYDFIEKPFKTERLLLVLQRALEDLKLRREIEELRVHGGKETELIGHSNQIQSVLSNITRIAPTNSRIMITGPAGTGKEVSARMIHNQSARGKGPFVSMNCATIRSDMIEVELFGVEPSSNRKDPTPRKVGIFERAQGGTLFLDEVSDLPLTVQAKLVRVMQDQSFKRIGGSDPIPLDVRVISTSNQDVQQLITQRMFREDLYYRLNVMSLRMPSLAERREDIPVLAKHFMHRAAESTGLPSRLLSPEIVTALQSYDWPGNVRQLRNVIEWLLIMAPGSSKESIKADALPPEFSAQASAVVSWDRDSELLEMPLREAREMFERDYLLRQVRRFNGNISKTAQFIGMERSALHRKLRSLNVDYQNASRTTSATPKPEEAANDQATEIAAEAPSVEVPAELSEIAKAALSEQPKSDQA